jgi:hypothetical protein
MISLKKDMFLMREEMNRDYEHLLKNIKNIKEGALFAIDEKHDKITRIGDDYIEKIQNACNKI